MLKNVAVVGGGFYGLMLAEFLSSNYNVTVFEKNNETLLGASNLCQKRIHSGMMYPNNFKTLASCLKTFKPFMIKFKDAIFDDFTSLYAVAKDSKISADNFYKISKENKIPIKKVKNNYFNNVESVFQCKEFTFDLDIIRNILIDECLSKNVKIKTNFYIENLKQIENFDKIFLCNYDGIYNLLKNSGITPPSFRKKYSEKIFFKDNFPNTAVTVVDGNYFSTMCLPTKFNGLKSLTATNLTNYDNYSTDSNYQNVFKLVKSFIPDIELKYISSSFGPKITIDDNLRTFYIRKENFHKDVYTILGGKITNVFELFEKLKSIV